MQECKPRLNCKAGGDRDPLVAKKNTEILEDIALIDPQHRCTEKQSESGSDPEFQRTR